MNLEKRIDTSYSERVFCIYYFILSIFLEDLKPDIRVSFIFRPVHQKMSSLFSS